MFKIPSRIKNYNSFRQKSHKVTLFFELVSVVDSASVSSPIAIYSLHCYRPLCLSYFLLIKNMLHYSILRFDNLHIFVLPVYRITQSQTSSNLVS